MAETAEAPASNSLYETDFFAWSQEQARLLRLRQWNDLDLENLIDEVQSVGSSERREIRNRMVVLLGHLLKWKFQPGRRGSSWTRTINDQRRMLEEMVEASPSLRAYPVEVFAGSYQSARLAAAEETGIDFTVFPDVPPFTVEQALRDGYLPKEPDLYDQTEG